jgi:hypothetical protein
MVNKNLLPKKVIGLFGLNNPLDLPGVKNPRPPIERYRIDKVKGPDNQPALASAFVNPGDVLGRRPDRKVILVDSPRVNPDSPGYPGIGLWLELTDQTQAAALMAKGSVELGMRKVITPELAKRIREQNLTLASKATGLHGEHHVRVELTTLSDGATVVKSDLVPCSADCPCKRRSFNSKRR